MVDDGRKDYTRTMKKEVAEKWVEALRSGEFKQGSLRLVSAYGVKDDAGQTQRELKYCCLGVLCVLAQREGVNTGEYLEPGLASYPPTNVMEWAGANTASGQLHGFPTLAHLNDRAIF